MIENNTGARDDWELSCGQYDYLHNRYTRVRRTEVNTNDLTHDKYTP